MHRDVEELWMACGMTVNYSRIEQRRIFLLCRTSGFYTYLSFVFHNFYRQLFRKIQSVNFHFSTLSTPPIITPTFTRILFVKEASYEA